MAFLTVLHRRRRNSFRPKLSTPMRRQMTVPFHAIALQFADTGRTRDTHVMPSTDVAAMAEPKATVQNTVPFQAIALQLRAPGNVPFVAATTAGVSTVPSVGGSRYGPSLKLT